MSLSEFLSKYNDYQPINRDSANLLGSYRGFDICINLYNLDLKKYFFVAPTNQENPHRYLSASGYLEDQATYFQDVTECCETINKYHILFPS